MHQLLRTSSYTSISTPRLTGQSKSNNIGIHLLRVALAMSTALDWDLEALRHSWLDQLQTGPFASHGFAIRSDQETPNINRRFAGINMRLRIYKRSRGLALAVLTIGIRT